MSQIADGPTLGKPVLRVLVATLIAGLVGLLGFEAQAQSLPPDQGPGGPILVVTSTANPFTKYYAEILRTEGFNAFAVADISTVSATTLAGYDVVILGQMSLTAAQVTMFTNWVNAGGSLIAMRPDKQLASLLGLSDAAATLSNAYLQVNNISGPGVGIVSDTIQFHGTADLYNLNGATALATLYSDALTPTANPAVTIINVGTNGGQAAAFTYDLARSVAYTRQGNPAWSGQQRDGSPPIRPDNLFYGAANFDPQPDWVDLNKVQIPHADEQQRLLANMILSMNTSKKPLPRFWYFPRGFKAVVIMTGDDHANGGTAGRFDNYISKSTPGCNVANWECVRSSSYLYNGAPLTDAQAASYTAQGFEVALHTTTNCYDWTPSSLASTYSSQLSTFRANYTSIPAPITNRMHCLAWSNYATQPQVELNNGIRLDTTYYYWPGIWIQDRPGMFTGSGMPMRFTDLTGKMIDVYQATTQMTDESNQTYPLHINTLLDNALGPKGYYGAFTVNAHTDYNPSAVSDAVVSSAQSRSVPIVSSKQMLTWLDGRNSSSFSSLAWNGNTLSFTINAGTGANGLQAMLPTNAPSGSLNGITLNGNAVSYTIQTIKGIPYGVFSGVAGAYQASYTGSTAPPVISNVAVSSVMYNGATITWTTDQISDSQVEYGGSTAYGTFTPVATTLVTSHSIQLTGLTSASTTYHLRVRSRGIAGTVAASQDFAFTTTAPNCPCTIWSSSTVPAFPTSGDLYAIEVGLIFRPDVNGYVTGVRFYKGRTNTGPHIANLWTSTGTLLATANFTTETATGWQQVNFATPVAVTANTIYVVSYHTDSGNYAADNFYFANSGVDTPPLHALSDPIARGNGVYQYGPTAFPTSTYQATNYWADLVFTTQLVSGNPVPAITGLGPASAIAGGAGFTLTVNGSGFVPGAVVNWNGAGRATTFVSSAQLTAAISASDIAAAGSAQVTVFNPAPGGGTSNSLTFNINNPLPATTSISPSSAAAGGAAFTLTVNGSNFLNGSVVQWNAVNRTTTFVSSTQLTAAISASDIATAGTPQVTVLNPAPGGGTSNAQTFTLNNPLPATTSISPTAATAGGAAFTLTVNGSNFVNGSVVQWNGANRTTTFVSATQLTAAIPASDIASAGAPQVTVFNPAPGGGTSNAQTFSISNPVPTTTSINPTGAVAGGSGFTLTVNGGNFVNGSAVQWNGANRATTFVSATQLTAAIPASDIAATGTAAVTVFNPTPGGGTSNSQTFTISASPNLVPSTTTTSPASAAAGGLPFTLTVNGTNFINGSVVQWNGASRATTFVSATQLTAAIPASDIATGGTPQVTVFNPAPGGGTSNAQTFTVNNPLPATTSISPSSATTGSAAFTLAVNGSNFVPGSVVRWNGANRTTTFVSATQLTAAIGASDTANGGTPQVTVFNPAPGGGTSNAQTFTVNNPLPATTSISPTSATAGGAAFTLTVNGSGFVPSSVVNWNGASRTTTFVSAAQLTAAIPATDIATAGTAQVTVFNPAPAGGTSNAQTFTISNAAPVSVTFDSPPPAGTSGSLLNGIYKNLNFGTGQWRWESPYGPDPSNNIYFDSGTGTSRQFSFANGPRVLISVRVFAVNNGTITLTDNLGQTTSQVITTGSMQIVNTGWTQASTTVTVQFTTGWDLGMDTITYNGP